MQKSRAILRLSIPNFSAHQTVAAPYTCSARAYIRGLIWHLTLTMPDPMMPSAILISCNATAPRRVHTSNWSCQATFSFRAGEEDRRRSVHNRYGEWQQEGIFMRTRPSSFTIRLPAAEMAYALTDDRLTLELEIAANRVHGRGSVDATYNPRIYEWTE